MNNRKAKALRKLANAESPVKGVVRDSTVLINNKSVVIIKGANKRHIYKLLRKGYNKIKNGGVL